MVRSKPLIGSLLCRVGDRLDDEWVGRLRQAFVGLEGLDAARDLLETLRISRFSTVDPAVLRSIERSFDGERAASP